MLTRVADAMFWMNAYTERAENLARFIHVNINSLLEKYIDSQDLHWGALVAATGDEKLFYEKYLVANQQNVMQFLIFDRQYCNSITSSIIFARENGKGIRDSISAEMWEQLNQFYYQMIAESKKKKHANYHELLTNVKIGSHLFNALADATLSHGEAWYYLQLGRLLERADKITRILDVKYHLLRKKDNGIGNPTSVLEWGALLRSAGALEMYRKKHHKIKPDKIIEFLLLDASFPRSFKYCIDESAEALEHLCYNDELKERFQKDLGRLNHSLADLSPVEKETDLHMVIDELQAGVNQLIGDLNDTFFSQHH